MTSIASSSSSSSSSIHQQITFPSTPPNIFIVGDIHGCYDELIMLINKLQSEYPNDNVIDNLYHVGDLVNKGPASIKVISFCNKYKIKGVLGNHDLSMLSHVDKLSVSPSYEIPPKYEYIKSLSQSDIAYMKSLPLSIHFPELNVVIIHAGFIPDIPFLDQSDPEILTKIRYVFPSEDKPINNNSKKKLVPLETNLLQTITKVVTNVGFILQLNQSSFILFVSITTTIRYILLLSPNSDGLY